MLVRHISACYLSLRDEMIYRAYVSDALYHLPRQEGMTRKYTDIVRPRQPEAVDAEEVVEDVIERAGLVIA